ncbi:MAG: NADPH:quinone reductase [Limnohabitans sp.]|nr:NADPH:quinone reductase [Limnohabitans sp.]
MKAAWYEKNGAARDVMIVGEQPTPQPAAGEVRVQLHCSGVNPSDVKSRTARPLGGPLIIPHSDGAGIIDAVGEGVDKSRLGERVWTWNAQWQRPMGTAAQFVCLPSAQAAGLPNDVSFQAGACMGIPGLTALQAVRIAGDVTMQTVLVTGASSAVGHYVTQMLKRLGAKVIGTVGSEAKAAHAKAAGADHCLFYKSEDVVARVKELTGGKGVDTIIDMDFSTTIQYMAQGVLRPHGHLVCYGSNSPAEIPVNFRPLLFNSYTLSFFVVYDIPEDQREPCVFILNSMLKNKQLTHSIGAELSLDQVVQAHETVEAGKTIGNLVINIAH